MEEISELDRKAMHYTAKIIGKKPAGETLHTHDVTQAFIDGYKAGVINQIQNDLNIKNHENIHCDNYTPKGRSNP